MRPALPLLALAAILAFSSTCLASHYELVDIDQVPAAARAKLAKVGITTTKDLVEQAAPKRARAKLARRAKLPLKQLTAWTRFCDLLRIRGVGPTMAALLQAAAVADIAALQKEEPGPLLVRVTQANKVRRITELLPGEKQLVDWIGQARAMPVIVE